MATIKDVAQLAGVSPATVSRVLRGDEGLSVTDQVRNQVFEAAHQLGYVSPSRRKALLQNVLRIGVADWHIVRQDRPNVRLSSLDSVAASAAPGRTVEFLRMAPQQDCPVDGIIAFGAFSEEELRFLRMQSSAIVFVDSNRRDYEYDRVIVDFEEGLRKMLAYLFEEKQYPSVGYIGGTYQHGGIHIGFRRAQGLRQLLEEQGRLAPEHFLVGQLSRESGFDLAWQLIQSGNLPRVLILGSDEVAQGALEAIRQAGLRIPQDLAVVIYQDIATIQDPWPGCTVLHMYPDLVWSTALRLLLDRVVQRYPLAVNVWVPPVLKPGESA